MYSVNDMYTCKDSLILGTILVSVFVGALLAILLNIANISWSVYKFQRKKIAPASHSERTFHCKDTSVAAYERGLNRQKY